MTVRSGIEILIDEACGLTTIEPNRNTLNNAVQKVKSEDDLEPATLALLQLADSAKAWWETFRPEVYSEYEHMENPTVNHLDTERNSGLCKAIAEWVRLGG